MTTPSLMKRLEALEANSPDHALRVVDVRQDWNWSPEERKVEMRRSLDALPPHKGLTVIIKRLFAPGSATFVPSLLREPETSRRR